MTTKNAQHLGFGAILGPAEFWHSTRSRGSQVSKKFDFLGYCFRPRLVRTREGSVFVGFTPGISPISGNNIRRRVRHWRLGLRNSVSLEDIAQYINPIVRGWINYYGAYQRSSLGPVLRHINRHLIKWVKRKYKKRGRSNKRAMAWLESVAFYRPKLFAHWQFGIAY